MEFQNKMFTWKNEGAEPSEELKQNGFQGGYKPPATVFNNFWAKTSKAITELQEKLRAEETARTNADTKKANVDLSNVSNDALRDKLENVGGTGTPLVNVTSADGVAYTATVNGIKSLYSGLAVRIIPDKTSTSTTPTLNINNLGAIRIALLTDINNASVVTPSLPAWISANKPLEVVYNGQYWIVEYRRTSANALYGTVGIANGGTGATTAEQALSNLGAAKKDHTHKKYVSVSLTASGWVESPTGGQWAKMWTQAVTNEKFEANALLSIDPVSDTNMFHLVDNSITLAATNNNDGTVTFKAYGAKPTINLTLNLIMEKVVQA